MMSEHDGILLLSDVQSNKPAMLPNALPEFRFNVKSVSIIPKALTLRGTTKRVYNLIN